MGVGPVLPLRTLRPPSFGRGVNAWSVGATVPVQQLEGVGVESRGEAGPVLPCRTLYANTDCAEFVFPFYSFIFCHL